MAGYKSTSKVEKNTKQPFSHRSWRSRRPRMSAPSVPIPRPQTALKQSNAQYEATIAREQAEKTSKDQPECPLCCVEFSNSQEKSQKHKAYSCPNNSCITLFCQSCKGNTLKHDYRCPFCRCELDGATVTRPRWRGDETDEADLLAIANSENQLNGASAVDEDLLQTLMDAEIVQDLIEDGVLAPNDRRIPTISRFPRFRR